jgi:SAM-dependent methyltransferase
MTYLKEAFDPTDLDHAKDIVLSPDPTNPEKFEEETAFLVDFIKGHNLINADSRVLDFGCGMGRISKRLIDTFQCRVVGTDISWRMLSLAQHYVDNEKFEAKLAHDAADIDLIIASLVLQHVENPEEEINRLYAVLKPGGHVVLLDDGKRFVPSGVDTANYVVWKDDGVSIKDIMGGYFENMGYFAYCNRSDTPLSIWRK